MSASTSTVHRSELSGNVGAFPGRVQDSGISSDSQVTASKNYDMSPSTRMTVYSFLLAGVLFLAITAAYVWHGYYLWQNLP